jgi:hypothetical protein
MNGAPAGPSDGATPLGAVYSDTGRYGDQLDRWLRLFDRDRIHRRVR